MSACGLQAIFNIIIISILTIIQEAESVTDVRQIERNVALAVRAHTTYTSIELFYLDCA